MDPDDSESAPMDLDLDAPEKDLGLDGSPAKPTPPIAQEMDASEQDLGFDGSPASMTPPTASDLDKTKTSDTSMDTSNQTTTGPDLSTNHAFSNQITIM